MAAAFGDDYYDAVGQPALPRAERSSACADACLLASQAALLAVCPTLPSARGTWGMPVPLCLASAPHWHGQEHTPPCPPGVHAVQDADLDDDDLADEQFEKELEAMAQYGSEDEDPRSFAALHKRLAAQRGADAAAGGARVLPCLACSDHCWGAPGLAGFLDS